MSTFLTCCRCERDDRNYLDAGSKMWQTICGHSMCSRCKDELYARHRVNTCPSRGCGATLTLSAADFSIQSAETKAFEEEKRQRKRVVSIFNKSLGDFGGEMSAYADYIEERERLVQRLSNGSEREKSEAEIYLNDYKKKNASDITRSAAQAQVRLAAEKARFEAEAARRVAQAKAAAEADIISSRANEYIRRHISDALALGDSSHHVFSKNVEEDGKSVNGIGISNSLVDEGETLRKIKRRVLEAQSRKRTAEEAKARSTLEESTAVQAMETFKMLFPEGKTYVAFPNIFPPVCKGFTHAKWMTQAVNELPKSSLENHIRAGAGVSHD
jgi:hypothetical protein